MQYFLLSGLHQVVFGQTRSMLVIEMSLDFFQCGKPRVQIYTPIKNLFLEAGPQSEALGQQNVHFHKEILRRILYALRSIVVCSN